jgi:hypothetical protein
MKLRPRLVLALAFILAAGLGASCQDVACGQLQADSSHARAVISPPNAPEPSALSNPRTVARYATRFEGDHSLDAATVTELISAPRTLYTVRLQFASGAEQSISVTAPPGGLQPEMRDMSGDSVANDLVLTSKLLGLPPIVLLNEGHDHLTVAISPGAFASGEDRASGSHEVHRSLALLSAKFKTAELNNCSCLHYPQAHENLLSPIARIFAEPADHASSSGRAPPVHVARIQRASESASST